MDLRAQVRTIEKELRKRRLTGTPKVFFFDSEEDYEEAKANGELTDDDVSIIDDVHIILIDDYGEDEG